MRNRFEINFEIGLRRMNLFEFKEGRIFGEGKRDQLPVASSLPLLFPFSFFLGKQMALRLAILSQKFLNYYIEDVTHLVYEIKFQILLFFLLFRVFK